MEMAGAYSLLQDMTCVGGKKPGFDEERARYWLGVLGRASPSRSSVLKKLMSEKPREISQSIETYYKKVSGILESGCWSRKSNTLEQLFKEYQSRHTYFTGFPLISYSASYDKFLAAERKRRMALLALALCLYKYQKATFPDDLRELGEYDTKIIDPVSNSPLQYRKGEHAAVMKAKHVDGFPDLKVDMRL